MLASFNVDGYLFLASVSPITRHFRFLISIWPPLFSLFLMCLMWSNSLFPGYVSYVFQEPLSVSSLNRILNNFGHHFFHGHAHGFNLLGDETGGRHSGGCVDFD